MSLVYLSPVTLGCDPEIFITTEGKVIGAEKVIGEEGLKYNAMFNPNHKGIVLDGVQVELNPQPATCRANMGNEIMLAFRTLRSHLESKGKEFKVSFASAIEMDPDELKNLSEKARILGCKPSHNIYQKDSSIKVNPVDCLSRSAAGHIHLGITDPDLLKASKDDLVKILDVFIGNTCVMIDRDPLARERRKIYGRAGEVRYPAHGLEYRVLSNFWLRSYPLFSMVMGMTKEAYTIWALTEKFKNTRSFYGWNLNMSPFDILMEGVDLKKVETAINENDLELAKETWVHVRKFIHEYVFFIAGVTRYNLPQFDYFLKKIEERGIEFWFPDDPLTHWCNHQEGHGRGWESFLSDRVLPFVIKENAAKKLAEMEGIAHEAWNILNKEV